MPKIHSAAAQWTMDHIKYTSPIVNRLEQYKVCTHHDMTHATILYRSVVLAKHQMIKTILYAPQVNAKPVVF